MLAQIHVTLKDGVLDPQGKTVHHALKDLGYNEVFDVQKKRIYNALLNSSSKEVINFNNVLNKIINEKI